MIENNKTEQAIIEALEKVCNVLPSTYRQDCDNFVKQYADEVIRLLLEELTPNEVCAALGLCSKTFKTLLLEASVLLGGSSVNCDRCERAVESIKAIFSRKETVEEAKIVLKFLCSKTGIKETECDNLVEQWVPAFVGLIARVSAREACVILEYCPARNVGEKKRAETLEKTLQNHISTILHDMKLASYQQLNLHQNIARLLSSSQYAAKVHIIPEPKTKSAQTSNFPVSPCGLCIFVLSKVEKMIITNRSEEEITRALEKVCSLMPAHARQECDEFMSKYFERVLDLFLKGVAPEAICIAIGLCDVPLQTRAAPALGPLPTRSKNLGAELKYPCIACQFIAMQFSMALFYEPYYKSIGGWFEKNLCSKLLYEERACKQFIDSEVPHLLKQLGAKIDPTVTCEAMRMCAPGENPPWVSSKSRLGAQTRDELCTACRYLEDLVRAYIEDMKHQNEIIDFLVNEGCNKTKDRDLEKVCETLIRELAPNIFMLIGDALDRDQACFALELCPNTTLSQLEPLPQSATAQTEGECTSCKLSISEIRAAVLNPITQDIIAKQLDTRVCPELKPMDDVCRAYVKDYLPIAFTLISKFFNAEALCTKMCICNKGLEGTSEMSIALPSALTQFQSNPEACQLCDVGLATVRSLVLQPVVKSYLQSFLLAHVCSAMGDYSQACLDLVRMEMPLVFDALNKLLTNDNICSKFLKFCDKSSLATTKSGAKNNEVCAGCKLLLTSARQLIQSQQTQILDMIAHEVCPHLGGAAAECDDWVKHLGPLIVQSLLSELDPDTLCNELNLCGTEILSRILKSRMSDKESPEICLICKFIISELHVMISRPNIQEKISNFLENKVCSIDKLFESTCKQFVKDQLPALLEALSNVLGDGRLCQVMKACDSGVGFNFFANILSDFSSGNLCNDCKQVVNQLKNLLENATYEESLVKVIIKEVCPHLSKPTECEIAVRLAGKKLIAQVAAHLDPAIICVEFKMCKSALARLPSIEVTRELRCSYCN
jgi:saposin